MRVESQWGVESGLYLASKESKRRINDRLMVDYTVINVEKTTLMSVN